MGNKSKEIKGIIISAIDKTKIARLQGEKVKPQQEITILLDQVSDEDFSKFMFTDKVSLTLAYLGTVIITIVAILW